MPCRRTTITLFLLLAGRCCLAAPTPTRLVVSCTKDIDPASCRDLRSQTTAACSGASPQQLCDLLPVDVAKLRLSKGSITVSLPYTNKFATWLGLDRLSFYWNGTGSRPTPQSDPFFTRASGRLHRAIAGYLGQLSPVVLVPASPYRDVAIYVRLLGEKGAIVLRSSLSDPMLAVTLLIGPDGYTSPHMIRFPSAFAKAKLDTVDEKSDAWRLLR